MLSDYGLAISAALDLMKFEMTLWGFTFSFWQIMLFGLVTSIILYIIWGILT